MSNWIQVATIYEIPEGAVHVVEVKDPNDPEGAPIEVALFRADGQVYAIEDLCTHRSVPLSDGHIEGSTIHCPLHGAKFCLKTGSALTPPASEPTRSFPVQLRDEFVDISI